jgi:hypothetical protein
MGAINADGCKRSIEVGQLECAAKWGLSVSGAGGHTVSECSLSIEAISPGRHVSSEERIT